MKIRIAAHIFILLMVVACTSNNKSTDPIDNSMINKPTATKFTLKASNNQYISFGSADFTLIANQPDASKAEAFEIVDMGNGRSALKASNGRFVCADFSTNSKLIANRSIAKEWEMFEIIAVDQKKIQLKTLTNKFVCADFNLEGTLFANKDYASDWETFIIEVK